MAGRKWGNYENFKRILSPPSVYIRFTISLKPNFVINIAKYGSHEEYRLLEFFGDLQKITIVMPFESFINTGPPEEKNFKTPLLQFSSDFRARRYEAMVTGVGVGVGVQALSGK